VLIQHLLLPRLILLGTLLGAIIGHEQSICR
jgi:hypothetical protein